MSLKAEKEIRDKVIEFASSQLMKGTIFPLVKPEKIYHNPDEVVLLTDPRNGWEIMTIHYTGHFWFDQGFGSRYTLIFNSEQLRAIANLCEEIKNIAEQAGYRYQKPRFEIVP